MPFTIETQGTFTQPATAVGQIIPLPSGCDYFKTYNYTQAKTLNSNTLIIGEWFGGGIVVPNDGIAWTKGAGSNAMSLWNFVSLAAPGFTYVNTYPSPGLPLTGTVITAASPAVASVVNTYSNGDQVVIYNAVGMQQISGMVFTISSVSGAAFTLLGLPAAAFAAAATAFTVRRVAPYPRVAPPFYYVTNITQAVQAQVTTSQANTYVVGQAVEFSVPSGNGMVQMNNFYQPQSKPPIITAIIDAYNFTVNVNSTGYTAFSFPLSAVSVVSQLFATVAPAGQQATFNPTTGVQTGYNFLQVPFHSGAFIPYMYLPPGAFSPGGQANDVIVWQAVKMETGTINAPIPS